MFHDGTVSTAAERERDKPQQATARSVFISSFILAAQRPAVWLHRLVKWFCAYRSII
jgi:hypothetical protein